MSFFQSDEERAQEEYEQGQKDGSQASAKDQFAQNLFKSDSPYQRGWDNGVANPKDN